MLIFNILGLFHNFDEKKYVTLEGGLQIVYSHICK